MKNNIWHSENVDEPTHGGDIYSEGLLKGKELIDFSSNINPLGVPSSFTNNIDEGIKALNKYPDIKYRQLKENLLIYLKDDFLSERNLILGNGAAEVIDLVISCINKILIILPSFSEYESNAVKWKCNIEYSYLDRDMKLNYEDILTKLIDCDAVILGNPNNPNGGLVDKIKLEKILDLAENNNKLVILDEAFIEFADDINNENVNNSFQDKVKDYKCIFIVRALTKFFALPGIRFGYGISRNLDLLSEIRKKQNPWNINCFAELAVKYVLKDRDYIINSHYWIYKERVYLPSLIEKISFIEKVFATKANFVLCKLKEITENDLYDFCLSRGIIIRRASNFKSLNKNYVRFAIKDRENNDKLLSVLHSLEERLCLK